MTAGYPQYSYPYGHMGASMPQNPQMMGINPAVGTWYNPQQYMVNNPQSGLGYGVGVNPSNTTSVPITGANLYSIPHTK
jgi:hypothetical protein